MYQSKLPSLNGRKPRLGALIYSVLLGLVPAYLCAFLQRTKNHFALRSNDILHLSVPQVQNEMDFIFLDFDVLCSYYFLFMLFTLRRIAAFLGQVILAKELAISMGFFPGH